MPGDRTEKATPRQRQKAAERGDRARSRDLMAGAAMLAAVFVLGHVTPRWVAAWAGAWRRLLDLGQPKAWDQRSAVETMLAVRGIVLPVLEPAGLLFLAAAGGAILAGVAQGGGWTLNFEALAPKGERINPAENAKHLFSLRGLVRLGKSLAPVVLLGFFAVRAIEAQTGVAPLSTAQMPDAFAHVEAGSAR